MMDTKTIAAIMKVIAQSNMSDVNLISVEVRPIKLIRNINDQKSNDIKLSFSDKKGASYVQLSDAWVAANILLFTVYDGYLENKYSLTEGASFKDHYNNLPIGTGLEIIEKDCYRVMKLIRNGIQHNLSNVIKKNGLYAISYNYRGTSYKLKIDAISMQYLYTLVINIISGHVFGMDLNYSTEGHYIGIMSSMYEKFRAGISQISDDVGAFVGVSHAKGQYDSEHLRIACRYPVVNPIIVEENSDYIVFEHIENNCTDDESESQYYYSSDYVYKNYLLPQEMGKITREANGNLQERLSGGIIQFRKVDISGIWKMK